ncbi:MAG: chemotaxis protein CheB, partial [Saprospiraceae bacterium]
MKKEIITVGIGASAGGLEAINEFFDHLDPETGMAFIVIQHLSPDFKSLMDELLSKHTKMPITVIHEPTPIKPNNIYLISKESNIIIEDGVIRPAKREERHVLNLPIDVFFHSLGKNQREHSIGVILSGTGSDGSKGIASIKEAGGLVLVQEPATAQFDGMPRAAMKTGYVDNILPPFAIAKTLMNLVKSNEMGYLLFLNPEDEKISRYFHEILEMVQDRMGVDFTEYRNTTLYRRIEKRMFMTRKNTIEDYMAFIEENEKEITHLYNEFLIGVTRFFRDKEAFDLLETKVISKIINDTDKSEPIRIWVAACSTGEEAYSLAILFQEYLEKNGLHRSFKIFASDLDSHAISIASKGTYGGEIKDNIPPYILKKYFHTNLDGSYAINKNIREKIVFTTHDALYDPPFINLDLVSCRNFLIYLKPEIQQKLLVNFQFALRHKSYLFLGPSESLGKTKTAFESINERWNIYQNVLETNLKSTKFSRQDLKERRRKEQRPTKVAIYEDRISPSNEEVFTSWLLNQYVPLLLFVNAEFEVLHIHGNAERLLSFPRGPGGFNLSKMLEEDELLIFKNGIRKTLENEHTNAYKGITFKKNLAVFKIDLTFEPAEIRQLEQQVILITIQINGEGKGTGDAKEIVSVDESVYHQERVRTLDLELRQAKREKQNLVERLETTNEELQSSNEELMAANEELQSTNEELQSVNEELYTVNAELQNKVYELTLSNNDMDNLLKSTGIGTIFVDEMLNIRRFTPAVKQQFKLVSSDIGRPITTFV